MVPSVDPASTSTIRLSVRAKWLSRPSRIAMATPATVSTSWNVSSPATTGPGAGPVSDTAALKLEPVEAIRTQRQEVRCVPDHREIGVADHFDGSDARERAQIEFDRLDGSREVGDAQNRVALISSQVGQHLPVHRLDEGEITQTECLKQFPQADYVPHPLQQRGTVALLRFDVDRLIAVDRIHDHRTVQPRR